MSETTTKEILEKMFPLEASRQDVEPWKKVLQRYLDYGTQIDALKPKAIAVHSDFDSEPTAAEENSVLVAGLPFRAQILVGHYQVGPLALEDINVRAERLLGAWKIAFTNPLVEGDIRLPIDSNKPLQINLETLRLNSTLLGAKPAEVPAIGQVPKVSGISVDPRALPLADMSVKALYM